MLMRCFCCFGSRVLGFTFFARRFYLGLETRRPRNYMGKAAKVFTTHLEILMHSTSAVLMAPPSAPPSYATASDVAQFVCKRAEFRCD